MTSVPSQRISVSLVAKATVPIERVDEPDALEVLRPRPIGREKDAASDDECGAEDQPCHERLVEEDERGRDGEERRRPDRHRRAGCAGVAHART